MNRRGIGRLQGAVALVTGGARGIGLATARELSALGLRVAVGDVDISLAKQNVEDFGALAVRLNVTDPDSWAYAVGKVEAELGVIDVLVNNAGIMPLGALAEESDAVTRRTLDINVAGVLYGCKAVLPGMRARGRGHLVNIASQAGKMAVAGGATYHASKYAVVGLTHALNDELRDAGVAVTAVLPGIVNTELSGGLDPTLFTPRVEPSDIARAIGAVLRRPRIEVWVPRSGRWFTTFVRHTPVNLRARLAGLIGLEDALLNADPEVRAKYEKRAAGDGE